MALKGLEHPLYWDHFETYSCDSQLEYWNISVERSHKPKDTFSKAGTFRKINVSSRRVLTVYGSIFCIIIHRVTSVDAYLFIIGYPGIAFSDLLNCFQ